MLRGAGADLVGMSTVMETIAARHLGAEVLGISMVSNPAAGLSDGPINHQDVLAATATSAARVGTLLSELLPRI
jgi:purine-nucleoside phosphorylase